jgi:hypothetical protein
MKVAFPSILLPKRMDLFPEWHTIACDQYTNDLSFWAEIEMKSKKHISTFNLIIPEVYLSESSPELNRRLNDLKYNMNAYVNLNIFEEINDEVIIVTRNIRGNLRVGLLIIIDLEDYSLDPFSDKTYRQSENTIEKRVTLRQKIREISTLELSHTIVFYDSEDLSFPENLLRDTKNLRKLYDIHLSDSESIAGYAYSLKKNVEEFFLSDNQNLNYNFMIVGDGNHSLAGAKRHWENIKNVSIGMEESNLKRYFLVEAININSPGVDFHPIHRFVRIKDCDISKFKKELICVFPETFDFNVRTFNLSDKPFYETYLKLESILIKYSIDIFYPHLESEVVFDDSLDSEFLFIMPSLVKKELFMIIEKHRILPKKSFSVGFPSEKRHYVEVRKF